MFSDFTHCGSMLIFGFSVKLQEVRATLQLDEKLLYTEENTETAASFEVNENDSGDLIIRALADSAEKIQKKFEAIRKILK